jgi:hypothetical protein
VKLNRSEIKEESVSSRMWKYGVISGLIGVATAGGFMIGMIKNKNN